MSEKRFNDEEVSLILRRAMEADEGRGEAGLTLSQLKEIAAEVGIDPAGVESAALAVQSQALADSAGGMGFRTTTRYEVEVPGAVDREGHADLLRVIRAAMGRQGVAGEEFGALEWKARDAFGGRYLTVRSEDGRTRVEALGNFRDGAAVSASVGGTLGLAASAITLKATLGGIAAAGLLGPVALLAGAAVPAALVYRTWFKKEDRALRKVVAEIAAQLERSAGAGRPADPVLPPPDEDPQE